MSPKYRLIYFNIRGRAEPIRMAFKIAGQDFEDVRLTSEEWQKFKAERGINHVPALEIDGKLYLQSLAISRYICREFGLYGSNSIEALQIDVICEHVKDLGNKLFTFYYEKDEKVKEASEKEFYETYVPKVFSQLEKTLIENNGGDGFMVGDKVSMADVAMYSSIADLLEKSKPGIITTSFPKLTGLISRMKEIPNFREYLESRPEN